MSFADFKRAILRTFAYPPQTVEERSRVTDRGYRFLLGDLLIAGTPGATTMWCHTRMGNGRFDMKSGFPMEVTG